MKSAIFRAAQRGSFLLEAMIGILIFSFGVLAMIALQANAISVQSDAQYRIEAASLADQILAEINLNVTRDSVTGVVDATALNTFSHQASPAPATGTAPTCSYSGEPATNALVTNETSGWVAAVAAKHLPGASAASQQIFIDAGNANRVTVTLCWQGPKDAAPRFQRVIGYIN
jgi:type IV pilus modification protein PilV